MQTIWVHYLDVEKVELATVVKVVRHGIRLTRVLLSNGRNDLVPSPAYEGDKVVMCPSPDGLWDYRRDAAIKGLRKMRDEGRLPDHAIELMAEHGVKI
jgi:hypothetical protein